ncbi:uracil-DNA glycosylase [Flavobacterium sp.]|uniref:uracil-DNA glycosylase n=1 Tax=Flavobacterium sp. TaxID=239 RepID=UPI003B9C6121
MNLSIHPLWREKLEHEFEKPYFVQLLTFLKRDYRIYHCYPPQAEIFAAYDLCPIDKIKVVIIGQDPYHGEGQANGLCFSVNDRIPPPPSLVNIFKELHSDTGLPIPKSGNLRHWAKQGVMLLNSTLTVRGGTAHSHSRKGWEEFTDETIRIINEETEQIIFLLWGNFASKKAKFIDRKKHFVLEAGHPSPLSANNGKWFGHKHFTKTNEILVSLGKEPIKWVQ